MKKNNIIFIVCMLSVIVGLSVITGCSGIKLTDNCGKPNTETFIVLPFVDDNYACNMEVENKIRNHCYNVLDGVSMLNEYSHLINKNYSDIEIEEFCDYAKSKNIDYVVIGKVHIEWYEGRKPVNIIESSGTYSPRIGGNAMNDNSAYADSKLLEGNMYYIVTGNYAVVDCYRIDTRTKEKHELFHNYKVKKIQIGSPISMISQ